MYRLVSMNLYVALKNIQSSTYESIVDNLYSLVSKKKLKFCAGIQTIFLITMYALPQHQQLADSNVFLQYKYYCKDKYQKKGTQSENEDGTNSFGVHIVKPFMYGV